MARSLNADNFGVTQPLNNIDKLSPLLKSGTLYYMKVCISIQNKKSRTIIINFIYNLSVNSNTQTLLYLIRYLFSFKALPSDVI